jgi:hypothetical protein
VIEDKEMDGCMYALFSPLGLGVSRSITWISIRYLQITPHYAAALLAIGAGQVGVCAVFACGSARVEVELGS